MSKEGTFDIRPTAALYNDYSNNFSDIYFAADEVVSSVSRIKARGAPHQWGLYQKYAAIDPRNPKEWDKDGDEKKGAKRHQNWDAAVWEAREDLFKVPVERDEDGPDPDNPAVRAKNMRDHLDTAVRIALFEKHQQGDMGQAGSGIKVEVIVKPQDKPWRRHKVRTEWHAYATNPSGDPKYKYDRLTITMTCPYGGWVGTAYWPYEGARKFTQYVATYTVPDPPEDCGQILFVFNGLESVPDPSQPDIQPGILQPVLQWTTSEKKWAIRSWYVPANYRPPLERMPGWSSSLPFENPNEPAWTAATEVNPGDQLQGIITWDVDKGCYVSRFRLGDRYLAELALAHPHVLPLTYPVAVIEAYGSGGAGSRVPPNGLVDVEMTGIVLQLDGSLDPVRPNWVVGTDDPDPLTRPIHFGTNRLQSYKIKPKYKSGASELKFTVKGKVDPSGDG